MTIEELKTIFPHCKFEEKDSKIIAYIRPSKVINFKCVNKKDNLYTISYRSISKPDYDFGINGNVLIAKENEIGIVINSLIKIMCKKYHIEPVIDDSDVNSIVENILNSTF